MVIFIIFIFFLMQHLDYDINMQTKSGKTILHIACENIGKNNQDFTFLDNLLKKKSIKILSDNAKQNPIDIFQKKFQDLAALEHLDLGYMYKKIVRKMNTILKKQK